MDFRRSAADRVFAVLLWFYPRAFRRRVGEDMAATFRARLADVRAAGDNTATFWLRTVRDMAVLGIGERVRPGRSGRRAAARAGPGPGEALSRLSADLRVAARMLRKHPTLSATAIVALALGIGATTATFSITWGTVLRGLPFERAGDLVHFERQRLDDNQLGLAVTPHDYVAWRERQRSFEDLGAYVEALIHLTDSDGYAERVWGVYISPASFRLLRARPALGRVFTEDEASPGGARVIVLGHRLWTTRFNGDSAIVGRTLALHDGAATVIGVMPEGFGFPIAEDFWRPLRIDLVATARGAGRLDVFGRLRPGVTIEAARAEFDGLARDLARAFPETNAGVGAALRTFREEYVGEEFTRLVFTMLVGGVLVLLIACANVANVLIARAVTRRKEIAVRGALGATPGRVMRQFVLEAAVLSAVSVVPGVALGAVGVSWFASGAAAGVFPLPHGSDSLFWWNIGLDPMSLAVVLGVTALTALMGGALPALQAARTPVAAALNEESRGSSSRGIAGFGRALVVVEVALTAGLLVAAGLTARSVLNLTQVDESFAAGRMLTARIALPLAQIGIPEDQYPDHAARLRFLDAVLRGLEARPDVDRAAVSNVLPTDGGPTAPLAIDGQPHVGGGEPPDVRVATVSAGWFDAFGVPVLDGRGFIAGDEVGAEPVAVVNASFARRYFPHASALHQRVRLGPSGEPWARIVGVVPDLWTSRDPSRDHSRVFVPLGQSATPDPTVRLGRWGLRFMAVAARGPAVLPAAAGFRATVAGVDPAVPVYALQTMDDVVARQTARYRLYGRYYAAFAAAALLLALIGVYGIMAFAVNQRRPEFGIRLALGAAQPAVLKQVLRQTMTQVAVGLALGAVVAWWLARGLEEALFQVRVWDPLVLVLVPVVLFGTGMLAGLVPAARAASVDPASAMRER